MGTDMNDLIDACFNIKKDEFEKSTGVELGDQVRVWCMYEQSDLNQNALCGLVWRQVSVKRSALLMFEILFLATLEHVRHQRYGQRMYCAIERFCLQNCFDLISVAAVPEQGIGFWESNDFTDFTWDSHNP